MAEVMATCIGPAVVDILLNFPFLFCVFCLLVYFFNAKRGQHRNHGSGTRKAGPNGLNRHAGIKLVSASPSDNRHDTQVRPKYDL